MALEGPHGRRAALAFPTATSGPRSLAGPCVPCLACLSPLMQRLVWTAHAPHWPPLQLDTKARRSNRASLWALASVPPWGPELRIQSRVAGVQSALGLGVY